MKVGLFQSPCHGVAHTFEPLFFQVLDGGLHIRGLEYDPVEPLSPLLDEPGHSPVRCCRLNEFKTQWCPNIFHVLARILVHLIKCQAQQI